MFWVLYPFQPYWLYQDANATLMSHLLARRLTVNHCRDSARVWTHNLPVSYRADIESIHNACIWPHNLYYIEGVEQNATWLYVSLNATALFFCRIIDYKLIVFRILISDLLLLLFTFSVYIIVSWYEYHIAKLKYSWTFHSKLKLVNLWLSMIIKQHI